MAFCIIRGTYQYYILILGWKWASQHSAGKLINYSEKARAGHVSNSHNYSARKATV